MTKPGIKFLREQDDPNIWYVVTIDNYAGVDYHGVICKQGGHWYFTYPETAEISLVLSSEDIMMIDNFMTSLKKYGTNGMFEHPDTLEDDWTAVESTWMPHWPK